MNESDQLEYVLYHGYNFTIIVVWGEPTLRDMDTDVSENTLLPR